MINSLWVRGVSYRKDDVAKVHEGDMVYFEPEPSNPYDINAIKVMVFANPEDPSAVHVGYVPKELCQYVLPYVEREAGCLQAYISRVSPPTPEGPPTTGLEVVFEVEEYLPRQAPVGGYAHATEDPEDFFGL